MPAPPPAFPVHLFREVLLNYGHHPHVVLEVVTVAEERNTVPEKLR